MNEIDRAALRFLVKKNQKKIYLISGESWNVVAFIFTALAISFLLSLYKPSELSLGIFVVLAFFAVFSWRYQSHQVKSRFTEMLKDP